MERPTSEEISGLAMRARAGDIEARNRIVEANLDLVRKCVKRTLARHSGFRSRTIGFDDLVQIGSVSLMGAARNYGGRTAFSAYASICLRGCFSHLMLWLKPDHKPMGDEDDPVFDAEGPLDAMVRSEELDRLASAVAGLDDQDREIMVSRYGLGGAPRLRDYQIAAMLGVPTREATRRAIQIEQKLAQMVS